MPQQRVVSLWVQTAPFPIGGNSKQNGRLVVAVAICKQFFTLHFSHQLPIAEHELMLNTPGKKV